MNNKEIDNILSEVKIELERAYSIHGDFHSLHEGYAILLEEIDELWDEIKKPNRDRDSQQLQTESIQVAAMAIKLVLFIERKGSKDKIL